MTETGDALGPGQGARERTPGVSTLAPEDVAAFAVIEGDEVRQRDQEHFTGRTIGRIETSREAALIAFGRRFEVLAQRVRRLAEEVEHGRRPATTLAKLARLREQAAVIDALGDFDALFAAIDGLERRAAEKVEANRAAKAALCDRAAGLCDEEQWNATAEAFRELQAEWKTVGSAGRDHDTELWTRFRAAVDGFFSRRAEHIAARTEARSRAMELKSQLALRAEALADSSEWKAVTAELAVLMEAWKGAGSAGRDLDQALWARFGAARTRFFERRGSHHRDVRRQQEQSRQHKESLCREAEELAGASDLAAACQRTKELQAEWKTTGQAAREAHEALWVRFRAACNAVFERAHAERATRESAWRETLEGALARKRGQSAALADSIERDEANLERWQGTLAALRDGGRADEIRVSLETKIADVTTRLAAKHARLRELAEAITSLESKLR